MIILVLGLILALGLVAGVSTHVDNVSQSVVNGYFESPDRVTDLYIDVGEHNETSINNYFDRSKNKFNWIQSWGIGFRWHVYYLDTSPSPVWEKNDFIDPNLYGYSSEVPGYLTSQELVPIISIYPDSVDTFKEFITMEQGNFTLSENEVIITGRFAANYLQSDYIGKQFRLFDWLVSTTSVVPPDYYVSPYLINKNWTSPWLTISGAASEESPILKYLFDLGYDYPGYQLVKNLGAVIMLVTNETFPSFWHQLKYQPGRIECPSCPSFETFFTMRVDHTQIDQINPASFLGEIERFEKDIKFYYSPYDTTLRFESPLTNILHEYIHWTTTARASLILLSAPIIFLGWYIADFTFKEIYRERRKEVSSLKSRGVTNGQIMGMLTLEAGVLVIIATSIGLFLGISSNYLLEYLALQKENSFSVVDQLITVITTLIEGKTLKNVSVEIFVSPLTIFITLGIGILLVFLGSIRPIQEILNWPIDEVLQTEHEGKLEQTSQELNIKTIRNFLILGIIGTFMLVSLTTLDTSLQTSNLMIALSIIGIGAMFIGLINGMAHIARLLPILIEHLKQLKLSLKRTIIIGYLIFTSIPLILYLFTNIENLNNFIAIDLILIVIVFSAIYILPIIILLISKKSQWYLIAREMSRHAKTTVAAFVVISLTLGFGIISSTVVISGTDYYTRDATLETGVDGVRFTTLAGREQSFPDKFEEIEVLLKNKPGVESVSRYYNAKGFILPDQSRQYPSLTLFNLLISWGIVEPANVLFVNHTDYFNSAYLVDSLFVGDDTVQDVYTRFNDTFANYDAVNNPYLPVIIDSKNAQEFGLSIGDNYYFAAARVSVFRGAGEIVGIADSLPPGLNAPFIILPFVPNSMWRYFSIKNPTSGYLVKTTNSSVAMDLKQEVLKNRQKLYLGIQAGMIPEDNLNAERTALELSTFTQVMNLDFLYAVILAGIGFLLILEFRTAQKSHEIGILKAVGMRRRGIMFLVLLEALIIISVAIITGSFIGMIGGQILTLLLPNLRVEKIVIFPSHLIVSQIIIAVIFALIGSIIASNRANRYNISILIKE
ncbi:MAG: FtsX-like permease family protein [Candidatus Hodarchaeales archaeon]